MAGWTRHGVVAVALLTTGACTTPRYAHPEAGIPVPESWVESQVPPAALDLTAYWQLLDDPLLTEFVEAAVAHNLDLAQSAARLNQARAQLRGARAGYFPQVSASGRASRDIGDLAQAFHDVRGGPMGSRGTRSPTRTRTCRSRVGGSRPGSSPASMSSRRAASGRRPRRAFHYSRATSPRPPTRSRR